MKKVLALILALVLVLSLAACGKDKSKCTICGKKATHTYQDSGYCDEHYRDALLWSMEHTN